jgi:hypothetical protein
MTLGRQTTLGVRWYRAGLYLCPPAFRREFGPEMVADAIACFRDLTDARPASRRACAWRLVVDLLQTSATQWWGTGLPVIALLSMVPMWLALMIFAQLTRTLSALPRDLTIHDQPLLGLELIVCTALLIIASTIAITLAFARPRQPRRRLRI